MGARRRRRERLVAIIIAPLRLLVILHACREEQLQLLAAEGGGRSMHAGPGRTVRLRSLGGLGNGVCSVALYMLLTPKVGLQLACSIMHHL